MNDLGDWHRNIEGPQALGLVEGKHQFRHQVKQLLKKL